MRSELSEYVCTPETCKYYKNHPVGHQTHKKSCDTAAIPQGLAEEVAEWVHFSMLEKRVHKTEPIELTQADIDDFDNTMVMASRDDEAEANGNNSNVEVIAIDDSDDEEVSVG